MQDVEQQWFEELRILAHALEVEALETGKRDRVLGVIEEESELAAPSPFAETIGEVMPERVGQHAERAQRRLHFIEIFDLVEQVALRGRVKVASPLPLHEHLQEEHEKIEIFLG